MKYYIYKIEFNDKCYIGQTSKHPFVRWGRHIDELSRNIHHNVELQNAYNENGCDEWEWVILDEGDEDGSVINLLEQFHVENHSNSTNKYASHNCLSEGEVRERARANSKRYYKENIKERRRINLEMYHQKKAK